MSCALLAHPSRIEPGPIGNRGALDLYYCDMLRAGASKYATPDDKTGEFGVTLTVPTEHLVFDLIVHRDLAFALDAQALVYAYFFAGSPPAVATPLVPRCAELHQYVYG